MTSPRFCSRYSANASMKALPKRKGNVGLVWLVWLRLGLNESPPEKEGKSPDYVLTDSQWKTMPQ